MADRWPEVLARLQAARVPGAELLSGLHPAERQGARLVVRVASPGLADWLGSDIVSRRLWQAICREVAAPPDGALAVDVSSTERERALRTTVRLQRRFDDLLADRPGSEDEANQKLASGYLLPEDGAVPRRTVGPGD